MTQPLTPATTLADLRPGDIGFGPIKGGAGLLVGLGQAALLEGFRVGRLSIRHVFVVSSGPGPMLSGANAPFGPLLAHGNGGMYQEMPKAVEAMPSGAREVHIGNRWTSDYAYVRLPEDYASQAEDAAAIARAMIGTPYSFASYAALAYWRFTALFMRKVLGSTTWRGQDRPGMGNKLEAWIDRRKPFTPVPGFQGKPDAIGVHMENTQMALPCEAICSVLADQAWSLTGKKIMQGVAHQCVTPGALARTLLTQTPGAQWFWPSQQTIKINVNPDDPRLGGRP